jgi:hypothetical protein
MISELKMEFLFFEPVSNTFEAAVELVRGSDRPQRARRDNHSLADDQILSWRIGKESVELFLSSTRVLRVFLNGDVIDWEFDDKFLLEEAEQVYAEEVQLTPENGDRVAWHPAAVLATSSSVQGLFLGPTTTLLYLEVRERGEVLFAQMADRLGRRMLFFEHDE